MVHRRGRGRRRREDETSRLSERKKAESRKLIFPGA